VSSFLIVFDRERGTLIKLSELSSSREADEQRFQLELEYRGQPGMEIVVLEAESQEQLRSTHARYFGSSGLEDLAKAATPKR
jgi:hypothetical protein